jgi:ubiquinone/menaquinone biosynthesis C-methylase UbiE
MTPAIDVRETARTRARYDRIAPFYDLMERLPEKRFARWRDRVWSQLPAGRILEVGIGTGKNLPYHPPGADVVGIDLSARMLAGARQRAAELGRSVDLREMDVQRLDFDPDTFQGAAATFVFCSVPDPVKGLQELGRVVEPGGFIVLLEHVRIERPAVVGRLMDLLDPVIVRVMGAHIARRTVYNVRRAGLEVQREEDLIRLGLVKLIVAKATHAAESAGP